MLYSISPRNLGGSQKGGIFIYYYVIYCFTVMYCFVPPLALITGFTLNTKYGQLPHFPHFPPLSLPYHNWVPIGEGKRTL